METENLISIQCNCKVYPEGIFCWTYVKFIIPSLSPNSLISFFPIGVYEHNFKILGLRLKLTSGVFLCTIYCGWPGQCLMHIIIIIIIIIKESCLSNTELTTFLFIFKFNFEYLLLYISISLFMILMVTLGLWDWCNFYWK